MLVKLITDTGERDTWQAYGISGVKWGALPKEKPEADPLWQKEQITSGRIREQERDRLLQWHRCGNILRLR